MQDDRFSIGKFLVGCCWVEWLFSTYGVRISRIHIIYFFSVYLYWTVYMRGLVVVCACFDNVCLIFLCLCVCVFLYVCGTMIFFCVCACVSPIVII